MSSQLQLTRRAFIASGFAAMSSSAWSMVPGRRRPNIIFVLADDLGYGDLSIYGQLRIKTPNIDRMAAEGMRFLQAYAGAPVCSPSRCTLMTGMHSGHARVRDNFALAAGKVGHKGAEEIRRANLLPEDKTVADYLKAAGYRTGLIGKWHLDGYDLHATPNDHGFDEFIGWLTQNGASQGYFPTVRYHNKSIVPIPGNANGKHGRYDTTMITEDSIDFITRHKDEPFFLYTAYDAPHSPFIAPDFGPYAHENWDEDEKYYAAMIHYLDQGVGKILATLKALEIDQDTIVFFASDNGPRSEPTPAQTKMVNFFDSNGPLQGYKRDMYEGGIHEPMIARWPRHIAAGTLNQTPVFFPDFLPTMLDLAGAPPEPTDGISIKEFLLNPKARGEDRFLYWEFYEPEYLQAARWGKWKAVRLHRNSPLELYDLTTDPSELRNIAALHPDVVTKMDAEMSKSHQSSKEYPDPPN